jgi:hypothetical protein
MKAVALEALKNKINTKEKILNQSMIGEKKAML